MLNLNTIIDQLKQIPDLKSVSEDLQARASGKKMPAAIIYLLSERPTENENLTGSIRQQIQTFFAVELVLSGKSKSTINTQLLNLRVQIRNKLYGFSPAHGFDPIKLSSSTLLVVDAAQVRWVDEFFTSYLASASRH